MGEHFWTWCLRFPMLSSCYALETVMDGWLQPSSKVGLIRYWSYNKTGEHNTSKDMDNNTFINRDGRWHFEVLVDIGWPLGDLALYKIIRKEEWKKIQQIQTENVIITCSGHLVALIKLDAPWVISPCTDRGNGCLASYWLWSKGSVRPGSYCHRKIRLWSNVCAWVRAFRGRGRSRIWRIVAVIITWGWQTWARWWWWREAMGTSFPFQHLAVPFRATSLIDFRHLKDSNQHELEIRKWTKIPWLWLEKIGFVS